MRYSFLVSSSETSARPQVLEWLKEGGLVAITITGLLLYVFLSLPATVFYTRLGTSPGEVGITYVSLLSGSTVELLAILIILTAIFLLVAFLVAFVSFYARYSYITFIEWRPFRHILKKPLGQRTAEELEETISLAEKTLRRLPELVEVAEVPDPDSYIASTLAHYRRMWELLQLDAPTQEQITELDDLRSNAPDLPDSPSELAWPLTKVWIRRRGRLLAAFFVVITVIILLPTLAFFQASQVLDGKEYFGHNLGAFDYRADLVEVNSTSPHPAPSIQSLTKKKLFLLGQNAQYVILYSSSDHSTIRVPITSVIINGAH